MRPVLITGGAPRLAVDAVRFLSVRASGATAIALRARLAAAGVPADLLLSVLADPDPAARRYEGREDLERELAAWVAAHPDGVVVMSAAVNDYTPAATAVVVDGTERPLPPGAKAPSGAEELVIRLRPAGKVIDRLRGWGLRGPLVGFKFEAAATVIASAEALRRRTGAALVVANSLCGGVQALVDGDGVHPAPDRQVLLDLLAVRVTALAAA